MFSAATGLRAQAHLGATGDDADHHGVLAIAPGRGIAGHAVYMRAPHSEWAEVAVVVADDLNDLGLAILLVIRLAQVAEGRRITGIPTLRSGSSRLNPRWLFGTGWDSRSSTRRS